MYNERQLVMVLFYVGYLHQCGKKLALWFSFVLGRTTPLFIQRHYVLMEVCEEEINRRELPDSRETAQMCTQKDTTEYVYI